jgi:hypothetical protein
MLKPDLDTVNRVMRRALEKMRKDGALRSKAMPVDIGQVFAFRPQDVEGIFTHKIGVGDGIWFCLKDGRIFDARGQVSEADRSCYGEAVRAAETMNGNGGR